MRNIERGTDDNRLFLISFERCMKPLKEMGFNFTYFPPEENSDTLILRYTGAFIIDIERDERLDVGFYCYPLHYDNKPHSMLRIGLNALIFMLSNNKENISHLFTSFWDPWDYVKTAELISDKFFDYYCKIEWFMKDENLDLLYRRIKETGMEFSRSI
ncbi:MAG: hypothetical protein GXY34_13495 [Syntrophomonadaceae bacterium]|nr:hypothetical protein [Syntrophomonadaceae bacterium]